MLGTPTIPWILREPEARCLPNIGEEIAGLLFNRAHNLWQNQKRETWLLFTREGALSYTE
jgi:hypothetical protein